jgi:ribosomal protein S18 acetylase RimI-like enzyme
LPEAQGKGLGRKLIEVFTDKLRKLGVPAVHLQVGKNNEGAVKFYEKVGFHRIKEYEHAIAFGINLD